MTTPFPSEPGVLDQAFSVDGWLPLGPLAAVASALLVFVSAGVIYLSVVEWRDRRRRRSDDSRRRP